MKLVNYTFGKLSLFLLLLMTIWGVFFYYTILEEVTDETDDSLENQREILVSMALADSTILDTSGNFLAFYTFRPIPLSVATDYEDTFYDSTVYIAIEDEYEPVRVMKSCFMMPNGQYYELEIMVSTLEREDMIEAILAYLLVLYLLLLISMALVTHFILKRTFQPLEHLLKWLDRIQPGKEVPPLENDTSIREFNQLNIAAVAMSNRSYRAYIEQKQFIENASHELQTPLAIVRGKIELLAENESLTEEQMKELEEIYHTLERAIKINKSLLLLSRIENNQYSEAEEVVINSLVDETLPDLMYIYENKNIELTYHSNMPFVSRMNKSLAQILITNLLKNALIHNTANGKLDVSINETSLTIKNTGDAPLDKERIFQRFYHQQTDKKESTGLGLAIAKSIATSYGLDLQYHWDGMHIFVLSGRRLRHEVAG